MMNRLFKYSWLILFIYACGDDDGESIPTVEERVATAEGNLRDQLMAPANGWILSYRPNDNTGSYYVLLDFLENEVRVQSDMPGDDEFFYDQTIPYRVDVQLEVELIFETYSIFHFLFEQNQSTFGGEFEFIFLDESDGVLSFQSKSDITNPTIITLFPASASASSIFSRDLAANLLAFDTLESKLLTSNTFQQLYIEESNVSVFWEISLIERLVFVNLVAEGATIDEILVNENWDQIERIVPYTLEAGRLILENPISVNLTGQSFTLSEFTAGELTYTGDEICGEIIIPVYSGTAGDLGNASLRWTLFESGGFDFTEQDNSYSVNALFVSDENGDRLSLDGSLSDVYPDVQSFIFNYGVSEEGNTNEPTYGLGFTFEDEDNVLRQHMRGFEMTEVVGNTIQITLTEEFLFKNETSPPADSEENLRTITDEIFEDGTFYISRLRLAGLEDLVIFKLRNPCSGYEFLLVQPDSN